LRGHAKRQRQLIHGQPKYLLASTTMLTKVFSVGGIERSRNNNRRRAHTKCAERHLFHSLSNSHRYLLGVSARLKGLRMSFATLHKRNRIAKSCQGASATYSRSASYLPANHDDANRSFSGSEIECSRNNNRRRAHDKCAERHLSHSLSNSHRYLLGVTPVLKE
jgi:hypothetical protein